MLRWISSLSEIPVHHHPRILVARPNPTDASKVHTDVAFSCILLMRVFVKAACGKPARAD
jgi:hypothetical protein